MKALFRTSLCLTIFSAVLAMSDSAYPFAIGTVGSIDIKGNTIEFDSFDSSDVYEGIWNVHGYYTNALRKAGGDIISSAAITNSVLNLGNANIAGKVMTGPSGSIVLGSQGVVGDLAWTASNTGIQPGWSVNDLDVVFPDIVLPTTIWNVATGTGTGGSGTVNGKSYDHIFNYSGNYAVTNSGTIYVGSNVSVRLNITASLFNPSYLYVAGTGTSAGRMAAYLNCPTVTLGADVQTQSGKAENLIFLGLPQCNSIGYMGNGNFTGAIYAPAADIQFPGGGSGYVDFVGSIVARTVQIAGHYRFHFDEALVPTWTFVPGIWTSMGGRPVLVGQNVVFYVSSDMPAYFFTLPEKPLYQWQFNGTNIPNATNSSLSRTNVQLADAGEYSVINTAPSDPVTSPPELLQVYPTAAASLSLPVVLGNQMQFTVIGVPQYNYVIESSTDLLNWSRLKTNVSPFVFADTNISLFPQRFFRAVYPSNLP